jgi:RNA polymerase sigma-70 factor (ECF subfamily)
MDLELFKKDIVPLRQKLFSLAMKLMGNEADAEDLVQETFLKLWNIREQLQALDNVDAFAVQITKNACIDRIRTRKSTVEIAGLYLETNGGTPYSNLEKANSIDIVRKIIENLPGLQRLIIRMRDMEDYDLREIAEITGTQESSVRVNLSRARKKVKEEFLKIMNYERHYQ